MLGYNNSMFGVWIGGEEMSIFIKGMKMPKYCDDCWALDDNGDYPLCLITSHSRGYNFNTREKRMPDCPLVEIKPHGDLIDRKALKQKKKHSNEFAENVVSVAEIDWIPTIIEAEDGT